MAVPGHTRAACEKRRRTILPDMGWGTVEKQSDVATRAVAWQEARASAPARAPASPSLGVQPGGVVPGEGVREGPGSGVVSLAALGTTMKVADHTPPPQSKKRPRVGQMTGRAHPPHSTQRAAQRARSRDATADGVHDEVKAIHIPGRSELWCRFCGKLYSQAGWLIRHEATCEEGWQTPDEDADEDAGGAAGEVDAQDEVSVINDDGSDTDGEDTVPTAYFLSPGELKGCEGTLWDATLVEEPKPPAPQQTGVII
jgi:hypothetical protein